MGENFVKVWGENFVKSMGEKRWVKKGKGEKFVKSMGENVVNNMGIRLNCTKYEKILHHDFSQQRRKEKSLSLLALDVS